MAMVVKDMHSGPWTERDLLALPEDGQRHELLEGSLLVGPPPVGRHLYAAAQLELILSLAAPSHLAVVQRVGVRLPGGSLFVPAVLVADREPVIRDRSGVLAPDPVVLVVEIVSPGSAMTDRVIRPQMYAQARIPSYWRVELEEEGPRVETFGLRAGAYASEVLGRAGGQLEVRTPFPLCFDPARLG